MVSQALVGQRVRRLRRVLGLGQEDFATKVGIAAGSVSKLENGRMHPTEDLVAAIADVLGCTPRFLESTADLAPTTRPWLRAYADAPKRAVDQVVDECTTAMEAIVGLGLKLLPDTLPLYTGDLDDTAAIEEFAVDVRVAAGFAEGDVVGNSVRAAERLGCVVLPMADELGRHLGLSLRANQTGMISIGRWTAEGTPVPGDRQRWTVAHEIGHLALHSALGTPTTAEEAGRYEKQANAFAGAFLAPGDAMLDELDRLGGRVTLRTLARIKEQWGVSIKALVTRFRSMGVIDAEHARSLFKQISARGWNKGEPVSVGTERAIWLTRAVEAAHRDAPDAVAAAARAVGLDRAHLDRWTDWSTPGAAVLAEVVTPEFGTRAASARPLPGRDSPVTLLSRRRVR
ncbi:ImmA/IrrE family metallo-endopeptidase [Actinokineospora guangxiensis]|uniref:ImmA/IrrE family metallo-endopeptidase n=1 Tax=Actinokineospora guangxiensis TaxID=1490288 RepID=A0ABW0ESI3_9PSEU